MKAITLKDKLTEAYLKKELPEEKDLDRAVKSYLKRKYTPAKISKITADITSKHDFKALADEMKRRSMLNQYIDAVVVSKIREWYKASKNITLDSLDETKFRSLVMQVMQHFEYQLLYVPDTIETRIDAIFHRKETKVAMLSCKAEANVKVGAMYIKQLKFMADYYNCEQALLVTDGSYDDEAILEASRNGITLLDNEKFLPLVIDLVENRKRAEKQILVNSIQKQNSIYLESVIKSPKSKVHLNFINYDSDLENGIITFSGDLINSGKRPVTSLHVEISLYNRYENIVAKKIVPAKMERLEGGESTDFKIIFDNILESDSRNLCRYEFKLEYSNTYVKQ